MTAPATAREWAERLRRHIPSSFHSPWLVAFANPDDVRALAALLEKQAAALKAADETLAYLEQQLSRASVILFAESTPEHSRQMLHLHDCATTAQKTIREALK